MNSHFDILFNKNLKIPKW